MRTLDQLSVGGITKDIVLCKPDEAGSDNLTDEDFASYAHEINCIFLNEKNNLTPTRMRDNIVHEVVHALIKDTGALYYLKQVTRLHGDEYQAFEENLVAFLGPALNSCLGDLSRVCDLTTLAAFLAAGGAK